MKTGGKVLYLDFDGPLHPEAVYASARRGPYLSEELVATGHRLFEHTDLLEELLQPYPTVNIVLSTAWAIVYGCARAAKRLPPNLRARVIGATYHSRMNEFAFRELSRGRQVLSDVARRMPSTWLAIDDVDAGWDGAGDHVVITDDTFGIAEPATLDQLRSALTRFA